MDLLVSFATPFLRFFKKLVHLGEIEKFKSALRRNPHDHYLRTRFAKYCLQQYFHDESSSKIHAAEAVRQFETIPQSEVTDLEVYYLMGKYFQGKDDRKAAEIYRQGVKRYNEFSGKSSEFKREGAETAFALVINLLKLETNPSDPEMEKFFQNIRKSSLMSFLGHKLDFNHPLAANLSPASQASAG